MSAPLRASLTVRVPMSVRGLAGAMALLAAWTGISIQIYAGPLTGVFRLDLVPLLFQAGWAVIFVAGILAAVLGWDILARLTFGVSSAVFVAAVASSLTDTVPFSTQFYATGVSAFGAIVMGVLTAQPLRVPPAEINGETALSHA